MAGNGLIGSLRVTLGANTAEFDRAMDRSRRTVADTSKGFSGLQRQAAASGNALKAAFAAVGAASVTVAARSFLSLADESKNLNAQLQLATARSGSFAKAQEDVARIAGVTREGLTATAALYGNFMRATEALGAKQSDAARATETFGKALKIGGADANAAASATLQFGQALASGALRGDEFNSIAEASPRIVRLIADAMGVTQGAVRALAAEGKLTSDVLFRALTDKKFTAGIDAEFGKLPVTFDQAMTLVHNAAVTTFGAFDQGGQFSTMVADFIGRGADGFASLSTSAEQFGQDTRSVMAGLGNVFDPLQTGGFAVFDALGIRIRSVSDQIHSMLQSFDRVGAAAAGVANFINAPGNAARSLAGKPTTTVYGSNLAGRFQSGMKLSAAQLRRDASARRLEGMGYVVPRNADGSINEAGIKRVPRPALVRSPTPVAKKTKEAKTPKGRDTSADDESYAAKLAAIRAAGLRAQADLTGSYEAQYRADMDSLDADRAAYAKQLATDARLTDAKRAVLMAAKDEELAIRRASVEQTRSFAKADETYQLFSAANEAQQDITRAQIDLADSAQSRRDGELRLLSLQKKQEAAELERLIATTRTTDPDWQKARDKLANLDATYDHKEDMARRQHATPAENYLSSLNQSASALSERVEDIGVSAMKDLNSELSDAILGANSLSDAFTNMGRQIGAALLDIAIQQAVIKPLANSLFGVADAAGNRSGGSFAGIGKLLSQTFGGGKATGGPIDPSSWYVVGERGPELFAPGVSGTVIPNGGRGDRGGGGGGRVQIVPSPYFNAIVDGRVVNGAMPIAQATMATGMAEAGRANAWRARQSLE
ncbi:hypothetical protein E5673_08580 [Sphingomonas sp. PAMC26645]|uniref:tape measure protein n=1 Tax=Sphingomonas sp. PAMC26645 TaxID=2565555 RepID=UPI00109DC01B|nr:tape measure protein [Sphingomonas sp. PAMC26645]QCB42280.1 hypothetical protein E5673_08580 [Sphingomonas sp. PAMC26645]